MKIIKPSTDIISEQDIYKKIELAGRVCYKSEDLITDTSHIKFIERILKSGHESVLEHSNICIRPSTDFIQNTFVKFLYNIWNDYNGENGYKFKYLRYKDGIVSGNVRSWRNFIKDTNDSLLNYFMNKHFPILFYLIDFLNLCLLFYFQLLVYYFLLRDRHSYSHWYLYKYKIPRSLQLVYLLQYQGLII